MMKQHYTFAIDTSDYAGNFERSFYAYLTGMYYEYYHADVERLRELFHTEHKGCADYSEYLEPRADHSSDEHGIKEFGIEPSPGGREFNTVVFFLREKPPKAILDEWRSRARELIDRLPQLKSDEPNTFKYTQLPTKILGFRLIEYRVSEHVENLDAAGNDYVVESPDGKGK